MGTRLDGTQDPNLGPATTMNPTGMGTGGLGTETTTYGATTLPDEFRDFATFDTADDQGRDRQEAIGLLNRLLRGEVSAVKSYTEVMKDVEDAEVRTLLSRNFEEHCVARDRLTELVRQLGGMPDEGGGAWTSLVDAMTRGANLFSTGLAIDVLKMGEKHGVSEYEEMLNEPGVRDRSAALLRSFLRGQFRHLERLDSADAAFKRLH